MNEQEWHLLEDATVLGHATVSGVDLKPGSKVRLRPRRSADIFDILLAGKTATVQSIEQDYDGNVLVAVTVDDDPGRDLGTLKQPGHRFFFSVEEVEPCR